MLYQTPRQEADSFCLLVSEAVLRCENRNRSLSQLPPFPRQSVYITNRYVDRVRLLNWKVWCMRYYVNLDFVVDTMLSYFKRNRVQSKYPNLVFGLSINTVTGESARRILEEAIRNEYPAKENVRNFKQQFKIACLSKTSVIHVHADNETEEYRTVVAQRQKALIDDRQHRMFRGNPWQ